MELLIYFLTVVLPGAAFLFGAWRYDEAHVGTGQNFMPTIDEMKDFI